MRSVRDDLTAFVSSDREAAAGGGIAAPDGRGVNVRGSDACEEEGGAGGCEGEREAGDSAIARTLEVLARLGEDLGRMVRLKGRVEHQVMIFLVVCFGSCVFGSKRGVFLVVRWLDFLVRGSAASFF